MIPASVDKPARKKLLDCHMVLQVLIHRKICNAEPAFSDCRLYGISSILQERSPGQIILLLHTILSFVFFLFPLSDLHLKQFFSQGKSIARPELRCYARLQMDTVYARSVRSAQILQHPACLRRLQLRVPS